MKHTVWYVSFTAAIALLLCTATAHAGWMEQGDAGPYYQGGEFQPTVGVGDLDTISGTTTIPGGIVPGETLFRELVDVYSIRITDPDSFYATTDTNIDSRASSSGDSRLFLLNSANGDVILMHDDVDNADSDALIAEPATFTALSGNAVHESAENVELVAGQLYLLAVTEFAITALDLTGTQGDFETGLALAADNFYAGDPEDPLNTNAASDGNLSLVGAIRPANGDSDWGSNLQFAFPDDFEEGIDYVVALQGATFAAVPEPGTLAIAVLVALGSTVVAVRRRLG
jgi:hypothetical protein